MKRIKFIILVISFLLLNVIVVSGKGRIYLDEDSNVGTIITQWPKHSVRYYYCVKSFTLKTEDSVVIEMDTKMKEGLISDGKCGVNLKLSYDYGNYNNKDIFEKQIYINKGKTSKNTTFTIKNLKKKTYYIHFDILGSSIDERDLSFKIKVLSYTKIKSISGVKKSYKIVLGETVQLNPTTNPKDAYLYYSTADEAIATVSEDGIVKGNKKGSTSVTIKNGNKKKTVKIVVVNPAPYLEYKNIELRTKESFKLELLYAEKNVTWTTSNPRVATVSSSGKIKGVGFGSCTITAKSGGKSYDAKITVIPQNPDFTAYIEDYYTRDNYFIITVKNYSNKPLTIHSSNAKACEKHYKSYDRNLYLSTGNVVIQPGKKKTLKFKVRGGLTWYNENDFWIQYYFTFDGKRYFGKMYTDDTLYQKGKKYVNTYQE